MRRSASGEGASLSASSRASTKRSISFCTHAGFETSGSAAFFGGTNDQCCAYGAPSSIHRLSSDSLLARELLLRIGRRHPLALIGRQDPRDQRAGLRLARHDRHLARFGRLQRLVANIQSQAGLPLLRIRSVTAEAVVRQDRPNVAAKVDGAVGRGGVKGHDRAE